VNRLFLKVNYDPKIDFDGEKVNMVISCTKKDKLTITASKTFNNAANTATKAMVMNIVDGLPFAESS